MTDEELLAEETVMNNAKEAIQEQIPYFKFAEQMFLAGRKSALDIKDTSDKKLEPILYKLKDLGVIKSWYYNGTYHAQ